MGFLPNVMKLSVMSNFFLFKFFKHLLRRVIPSECKISPAL